MHFCDDESSTGCESPRHCKQEHHATVWPLPHTNWTHGVFGFGRASCWPPVSCEEDLRQWKQHECPFTSPCCAGREITARSFTARPAMKPAVCSPERLLLSTNGCGASHTYKLTTAYFSTERPKLDKRFCPDFTKHHHSANLFNESTSFWIIHSYKELFFFSVLILKFL